MTKQTKNYGKFRLFRHFRIFRNLSLHSFNLNPSTQTRPSIGQGCSGHGSRSRRTVSASVSAAVSSAISYSRHSLLRILNFSLAAYARFWSAESKISTYGVSRLSKSSVLAEKLRQ